MASNPATVGLEDNIEKLKNLIYAGDTTSGIINQITSQFLPYEEIAKKLILLKNQKMTKEDADLMIDGPEERDQSTENKAAQFLSKQDAEKALSGYVNTPLKELVFPLEGRTFTRSGQTQSKEERKEDRKAKNEQRKEEAKAKTGQVRDQFIEEAKKIVEQVKKALFKIISEQANIIQELVKAAISFGVSIPAMAVMVAAPPWNVAAAIALVLGIIETLNALAKRLTDIVEYLDPLKQLKLLLPDEAYQVITLPLNIAIIILIGIYTPIAALKKGIDSILAFLLNLISPGNISGTIDKIKRQKRKKERERDNTDDDDERQALEDEIEGLETQCRELENGNFDKITFTDADLKNYTDTADIYEEIKSVEKLANDVVYVYDVKLPDGTIMRDLSLDQLEEIKERYDIVFNNQQSE